MKKPQNRFIEEIEKDSAGSFAGSSENRSSGAGVAGKNDSSRKCGARGDLLFTTSDECLEILPSRNADTEIFEGTKAVFFAAIVFSYKNQTECLLRSSFFVKIDSVLALAAQQQVQ